MRKLQDVVTVLAFLLVVALLINFMSRTIQRKMQKKITSEFCNDPKKMNIWKQSFQSLYQVSTEGFYIPKKNTISEELLDQAVFAILSRGEEYDDYGVLLSHLNGIERLFGYSHPEKSNLLVFLKDLGNKRLQKGCTINPDSEIVLSEEVEDEGQVDDTKIVKSFQKIIDLSSDVSEVVSVFIDAAEYFQENDRDMNFEERTLLLRIFQRNKKDEIFCRDVEDLELIGEFDGE